MTPVADPPTSPTSDPAADPVGDVLSAAPTASNQQETVGPSDPPGKTKKTNKTGGTKAAKKGPVADTPTPRKSKYLTPQEFKGHEWADTINTAVNDLDPQGSELPQKALMGESYVATLFQFVGGELHSGWAALVSTVVVGGVITARIITDGPRRPAPREKAEEEGGLGLAARLG